MEKDFMKLLKDYIDKMQELWKDGNYTSIHTLAVAIADMTKYSDMIRLITGHGIDGLTLRKAADLAIRDEKKDEY